jgi:hypothetical protein
MTMKLDRVFLLLFTLTVILFACKQINGNRDEAQKADNKHAHVPKPPSSFEDTIRINTAAAVFFQPDSLQLQKIKEVTSEPVFKSSMHEYTYQAKNAHNFLKAYWPHLKIIDARNIRYLLFYKKDSGKITIDLNKQDPCGMFVFDRTKAPLLIDMMNVETQVPNYYSNRK